MLKDAVKTIRALLSSNEPEDADFTVQVQPIFPLPEVSDEEHQIASPDRLSSALSRRLEDQGKIVAGSLELVGLDDVKAALGESWPPIAARVREVAEEELQRYLDPLDIFRPHGEAAFLVHFDTLDKTAAEQKAQLIAQHIRAALAEQITEVADAVSVNHFVADMDAEALDGNGSLVERLFARLTQTRRDAEAALRRERRSVLHDLQLQFSPVWHAQKHVTILNRCLVNVWKDDTIQMMDLVEPGKLASARAEIDYLALTKSIEALHSFVQSNRVAMILVPVDFATLNSPETRKGYGTLLAAIPPLYHRLIALEISASEEIPAAALLRVARGLRPQVPHVAIELSLRDARLAPIAAGAPWAISVDLAGSVATESQLPRELRNFAAAADRGGIVSMARGVNSVGLAAAAVSGGFTYVDGPAIHLPMREPRLPSRLRLTNPLTSVPSPVRVMR